MKKPLSILLLVILMLNSCVRDDIEACSGTMHLYFSYIYGGTNRFFETVTTPTHIIFYKADRRYRELEVGTDETGLTRPYRLLKTQEDIGDLEIISWTLDDALDYVDTPETPLGEGIVKLKEMTAGSRICRPVSDLLYGRITCDAGSRLEGNILTIPFVRAVCRTRITMIPPTVEGDDTPFVRVAGSTIPSGPEDYVFHLNGTRSGVDYNNVVNDDEVILQPKCYFDENSANVTTHWFGSFSSEGKYLDVNVFVSNEQVAHFDCEPIGLTSVPGNYVDLVIDGRYVKPIMEVRVNGWRLAVIESNM
ncbi:FimB/Mfa2 family fimbrial subunit [Bacteroides sp.]|uniref:FimB/Mfa2 family fimbrial subunit n=1 Tax=Bacteroides sp. TaxID=29523 RepID=UPI0025BF1F7D|nr:FimB/Mfa2 family fimbrial subunit [Bacteroides sp.]